MIKLIDSSIFFNRKYLNSTNINNIALNSFLFLWNTREWLIVFHYFKITLLVWIIIAPFYFLSLFYLVF